MRTEQEVPETVEAFEPTEAPDAAPAPGRWVWVRRGAIGAGVVALLVLLALSPRLLRRMDAFRVRQVEVVGTRYLAPHEALERSGIGLESNVFDDPAPWISALRAHPRVAAAEVERELPGTIVLTITEVEPMALARTPALVPVSGDGLVLPIDMRAVDVDLPVLTVESDVSADGRLEAEEALAVLAALSRLRRLAPEFAARVSEAGREGDDGVRLLLRRPADTEVMLPMDFEAARLEQLRLTLADLESRDELSRVRRIDVRYRDQVVVSFNPGTRS